MEGIGAGSRERGKTYPLRELLRTAPAGDRPALLLEHLRRRLAESLGTTTDHVPVDRPVTEIGPSGLEPMAFYLALRFIVQDDLGILVYPVELAGRPTLRLLAEYVAGEVLPGPLPEPEPWTDLYEGGNWSWPLSRVPAGGRKNPGAVFVLSAPRSGSTLFRTMLAGHPGLFAPPELNLLPFDRMGERGRLIDRLGYQWMRSGPGTALSVAEGLAREAVPARLAQLEAEDVPVQDVYRTLQEGASGRTLVDKSPLYAGHPEFLPRAEALFESPKYLVLTRHPYSVMESFVRMRFSRLLGNHWLVWDRHPWVFGEKFWTSCYRHILDFTAGSDPARSYHVRYEELVTQPERVMRGVCEFLGVPYDPAVTRPYEGERMQRNLFNPRMPDIGDPNLLNHRDLDPGLATAWQRIQPPQRLGDLTRRFAEQLGYSVP